MRMRSMASALAAALGVVLVHVLPAQGVLANHPIIGSWDLNSTKSVVSVTLDFAGAADDAMTMVWAGQKYTFKFDGKSYPTASGESMTWTQKGPNRWQTVYKVRGRVDNIDQIALSADDKTLTVRTDRVPTMFRMATRSPEEMVFERVSGDRGLTGAWKTVRAAIASTAKYSGAGDKLSVRIEPSGERWTGPLDGKDRPVAPTAKLPAGVTWSGLQDGPRTIKFVLKLKGAPIQYATHTVSADGKTLEIVQINGATETAPDRSRLIFERR